MKTQSISHSIALLGLVVMPLLIPLGGCGNLSTRQPSAADVQVAEKKDRASVEALKIPAADKAAMEAHLGGSPVPTAKQQAQAASQKTSR